MTVCGVVTVYVGDTSHRQYAGPDSLEVKLVS